MEFNVCNRHRPVKVSYYKQLFNNEYDEWIMSYGNYMLVIRNDCETRLYRTIQPQLIAKFDYELSFTPEQFPNKLKTMLTFL
jgi:hypothetical protein